MSNEELLELIRKKQHSKAFYRLYKYLPVIKKMIVSKGGSKQDAEDIFQESLIVLCRKAENPGFALTSSIDTYLYSVCFFLWKNEMRKRNKIITSDTEPEIKAEESDIHELLEKENRFRQAEESLKKLGEKCLELLQLFYVKMMSMKDIAGKMGFSSEKIAKNQKYKCLERARAGLSLTSKG